MKQKSLTSFAWLSIATSIVTLTLKTLAYLFTGSVGLLSDALESIINLVAGIMALFMLKIAEKPPDEDHLYGHTKAEYFSSIVEGILIFLAAIGIGIAAVQRLIHPQVIHQVSIGLFISAIASIINFLVAVILLKAGNKHNSIALKADGHHLLTDVWTSAGVIVAVAIVGVTGWQILDPIVALLVAANIVITGLGLIKESILGFMDTALLKEDHVTIESILKKYCQKPIQYHGLLTRQSARRKFVSFHILVPDDWLVKKGHDFIEKIEKDIRSTLPNTHILSHLEPLNDKRSWEDETIDRI